MGEELTKIDTQGMSGPTDPNYDPKNDKREHKPATVTPRRLFTPQMVKAVSYTHLRAHET